MRKTRVVILLSIVAMILLVGAIVGMNMWKTWRQEAAMKDLAKRLGVNSGRSTGPTIISMALDPNAPTDLLMEAVRSSNILRCEAAKVLGLRADRRAVDALIEGMGHNQGDPTNWCIWALVRIGDQRAVAPLIARLERSTKEVMAVGASLKAATPTTNLSFPESLMATPPGAPLDWSEIDTIGALGDLGDARAVEPLIARLKVCKCDAFSNPRTACVDALIQLGLSSTPPLVAALKDSDQKTQQSILEILGWIGDPRAVKPIIDCLSKPHVPDPGRFANNFTNTGLLALAQIGSPAAFEYLSRCPVGYDFQDSLSSCYLRELLRHCPEAHGALMHLVTSDPDRVRFYKSKEYTEPVCLELARLRDPQFIPSLISLLRYPSGSEEALVAMGAPAIEPLVENIKAKPDWASLSIRILGEIDDPHARTALWEYIRANPKNPNRGVALVALAHLKDKVVIPVAREWLSAWPKDTTVTSHAIDALAAIGDTESIIQIARIARTPVAGGPDRGEGINLNRARVAAVNALVALKASDAGAIAMQVAWEPQNDEYTPQYDRGYDKVSIAAINALATLKVKDCAPVLSKIISNPIHTDYRSIQICQVAIDAMGRLGDPAFGPALLALLDKGTSANDGGFSPQLRGDAADALAKTGAHDTAAPLSKMLARWGQAEHKEFVSNCGMPDGSIKRYGTIADALCRAIASSGDANALDLLTVALQAKNASVRDGAVQALGDLGDKRAFGHLVAMLKQDDKGASSCDPDRVADAMFKLDAEQAVEPLTKWLTRKPPSTFGDPYLVRELGRRKVPQAAEAIKEELLDTMFRWNSSILGVERSGYDQSLDQCKERASLLAYEAPIAYGRCAGIEAVPLLLVTMRSPNCYHRVSAAQALGELRDRRAVDCLVVALGDQMWPVQEAAAIALRQIGDPAAIGALEAAGQHSDWRVRKASREAVLSIQKTTPTSSPSSQP